MPMYYLNRHKRISKFVKHRTVVPRSHWSVFRIVQLMKLRPSVLSENRSPVSGSYDGIAIPGVQIIRTFGDKVPGSVEDVAVVIRRNLISVEVAQLLLVGRNRLPELYVDGPGVVPSHGLTRLVAQLETLVLPWGTLVRSVPRGSVLRPPGGRIVWTARIARKRNLSVLKKKS